MTENTCILQAELRDSFDWQAVLAACPAFVHKPDNPEIFEIPATASICARGKCLMVHGPRNAADLLQPMLVDALEGFYRRPVFLHIEGNFSTLTLDFPTK